MRPAKKPMKAPFVVTVSALAAVASLAGGCGGKVPGAIDEQAQPPSNPPGPRQPTTCTSTTQAGDPCALDETTCTPTSSVTLGCANGTWERKNELIGNPPIPEPCPPTEPTEGDQCWQSNGGTQALCAYSDSCKLRPQSAPDFRTYHCYKSGWQRTTPAYTAECPASPPQSGESCAACASSLPAECTYGAASSSCPPAVAACDPTTLKWTVAITSCNPPPPPQDAGAP